MGKYIVTTGQNIYDVALHIYGSIEGITDLLINNASLSMADDLTGGQELIYSDDFRINADVVAYNQMKNIVPANGERTVYYKEPSAPRFAEFRLAPNRTQCSFAITGTGAIEVDWGDNSPLQKFVLDRQHGLISHAFDNNISSERKVRIYGECRLQLLDLTGLNPLSFFFYRPQYIEEFILRENGAALEGLALLKGTYRVDLSGCKTRNLLPLSECRDAMTIDLTGADLSLETLDEYLIDLVKHHYGRRNARLILSLQPSGEYQEPLRDENLDYNITTGMEAVWLLLNEPSWNEGGLWQFDIDGTIYKASTPENQPPSNKEPEPDIEDDYDLDFTDPEIP